MSNKKFGYARVSMCNQDLALQLDALKIAGVKEDDIYVEKISGRLSKAKRPQLNACLKKLKEGDSLVVWKLDRLGRSLKDLINIIQELEEKKIRINSLTETIDTSSPTGRLIFHMIAAFGEFERNLIKERSTAGLAAARKRGVVCGRHPKLSLKQQEQLITYYKAGVSIKKLKDQFSISKTYLYNCLHKHNICLKINENQTFIKCST
ncbi:MAG: recombinase family protein [Synergistaceae bacterium]|jgi:DNA invertase Pin-like site-specific DNA recombinase|nr:recombinase family protein [Synergistaceae bacterium]